MSREDDLRMGSLFVDRFSEDNQKRKLKRVGIIGYAIDEGVRRNGGRIGAADGPKAIRQMLMKKGCVRNKEYDISLEDIEIKDFGDTEFKGSLKAAQMNHKKEVVNILEDGCIPISIGGGNDQSYANFMALSDYLTRQQISTGKRNMLVINIDAHLDVRPLLDGNEPHSGSPFRQMLESDLSFSLDFVEFACQGSQCSMDHAEYVKSKGGQIIWLKDIQGSLLDKKATTKGAVEAFHSVLSSNAYDLIFVSFDIDSIRSADCPGVSCPSIVGLTADDALSICYAAGQCSRVRMLDISEFNPTAESYRTSILVANMIYYFLLGLSVRND